MNIYIITAYSEAYNDRNIVYVSENYDNVKNWVKENVPVLKNQESLKYSEFWIDTWENGDIINQSEISNEGIIE